MAWSWLIAVPVVLPGVWILWWATGFHGDGDREHRFVYIDEKGAARELTPEGMGDRLSVAVKPLATSSKRRDWVQSENTRRTSAPHHAARRVARTLSDSPARVAMSMTESRLRSCRAAGR